MTRTPPVATIVLALIVLALGALALRLSVEPLADLSAADPSDPASSPRQTSDQVLTDDLAVDWTPILERPLFSPLRRPREATAASDAADQEMIEAADEPMPIAPPPEAALAWVGLLIGEQTRLALFRLPDGSETWVAEGGALARWDILEIGEEELVLGSGGAVFVLTMEPIE